MVYFSIIMVVYFSIIIYTSIKYKSNPGLFVNHC